jgi:hypothetical protein
MSDVVRRNDLLAYEPLTRVDGKGEKADSVYPGYGRDPADPGDPEDTMAIRGYNGDTGIQWRYGDNMAIQRIHVELTV